MCKLFFCVLMAALSWPAAAQVYKCKQADGSVAYQQAPCKGSGVPVDLKVHKPSAESVAEAEHRAMNEVVEAAELRAQQNEEWRRIRAKQAANEQARAQRKAECQKMLSDADKAERESGYWYSPGLAQRDYDRSRALRDKHFTECFSR